MKKHSFVLIVCTLTLVTSVSSCKTLAKTDGPDALAAHIETTIIPGDDFFEYANGAWFKQHPIPASEQSNGIFQLVQDTINAQIRQICESSAAETNASKGSNKQKIGDFFFSGMDSVSLNKKGINDLKAEFDRIDQIKDLNGIIQEAAYIQTVAGSPLFSFWVSQDDKNSSKYQIFIHQGGLSLPDRAYFFDTDARTKTIREKFVVHVGKMYEIMGIPAPEAKAAAAKLIEMETVLAKVSRKREDLRDPFANYNKLTFNSLKKLDGVIMKVGYPDKWKDLRNLEVDRSSYVKNVLNANKWGFQYMISKYGKPVDRLEWGMQPQTYNAYYNPSNNEIVIPGCNITAPGYEGKMADDAILYAIIGGSTFGHEITHGFDDQGCKFDAAGNLKNWWTSEDSIKFSQKTKMIVEHFNEYVVVDELHINGELTQGENIADLGGVIMGYEAFKKTKQFKENQIIAGLNPNQRYFLGYALAWMVNIRPEALANQVKSDEHSPAKWRIIGPLSNIPEFFHTFNVKPGNKMYRPDDKLVKIW